MGGEAQFKDFFFLGGPRSSALPSGRTECEIMTQQSRRKKNNNQQQNISSIITIEYSTSPAPVFPFPHFPSSRCSREK